MWQIHHRLLQSMNLATAVQHVISFYAVMCWVNVETMWTCLVYCFIRKRNADYMKFYGWQCSFLPTPFPNPGMVFPICERQKNLTVVGRGVSYNRRRILASSSYPIEKTTVAVANVIDRESPYDQPKMVWIIIYCCVRMINSRIFQLKNLIGDQKINFPNFT